MVEQQFYIYEKLQLLPIYILPIFYMLLYAYVLTNIRKLQLIGRPKRARLEMKGS